MVLSREKEPVKFKGNKVWYLNKLSKMGAGALGCKVPVGHDASDNPIYGEETTIQDMIDYLTLGGGGSAESLIPKRVIYINADKDEVEGECYKTFAAAKTYMESDAGASQKFCVYLPAGDITEQITLSDQWDIKGNRSILRAPLKSKITMSDQWNFRNLISDCVITEGFETVEMQSESDALPVYMLSDCTITQIENDADEPTGPFPVYCVIFLNGGYINITNVSNNPLKRCGLFGNNVLVQQLTANMGDYFFIASTIYGNVTSPNSGYSDPSSIFYYGCKIGLHTGNQTVKGSQFNNCTFHTVSVKVTSDLDLLIYNCNGACRIGSGRYTRIFYSSIRVVEYGEAPSQQNDWYINTSKISFDKFENDPQTPQIIGTLNTDAVSKVSINSQAAWTIMTDRSRNNIMYSTDGGTTMTKDSTGATHYGIAIDSSVCRFDVADYMWFAMPAGE